MAEPKGGLEGAVDWLGALGVATKITTVIALAALAVIVAFLLSSQWLAGRRHQISQAIDKGDDDTLAALLGTMNVSLDGMSPDQKFAFGREESRRRFWQKMVWQSFLFAGFLGLLVLVWALVQPKGAPARPEAEPRGSPTPTPTAGPSPQADVVGVTALLLALPEDQRYDLCLKAMPDDMCGRLVRSIAGSGRVVSEAVEQEIAGSLGAGEVPADLASRVQVAPVVKGRTRLTSGDPDGWDVVFRWCTGTFAKTSEAKARAAAAALARVPGERIAPGVKLGAVELTPIDRVRAYGQFIATDASRADATAAIRATLAARGFDRYGTREMAATGKWRIDVYQCDVAVGASRGAKS